MSKDRRHGVITVVAALAALLLSGTASAANWSPAGLAFSTSAGDATNLRMVSDGRGGFIAAWIDPRNTPAEIYAQRVDSSGVAQWTAGGVLVSTGFTGINSLTVAADGQNGIVLAWVADRPSSQQNIYVQRLDAAGAARWTANGLRVDTTTANAAQSAPAVCADGAGGAVVAWVDRRAGNDDVFLQRVTSDSSRAWTAGGVGAATGAADQANPRLVDDAAGGAFVSWETAGSNLTTRFQHFDATGAAAYAAAFLPGTTRSESAVMMRTGASSLMVAWFLSTSGQLHATTLDAAGVAASLATQVVATTSRPVGLVPQSGGGALLAYSDGARLDVVRLTASGVLSGSPAVIATSQTMGANPSIVAVSDGADGMFLVWPASSRVFTRHVSATPAADWNGRVALASGVTSVQSGAVAAGGTDLLVAWIDDRNALTTANDLFAQRVSFTGVTGSYHRILTAVGGGTGVILPAEGRIYVAAGSNLDVFSEGTGGQYVDRIAVGATNFPGVPNYTFHDVNGDSTFTVYCSSAPIVTTLSAVANSYRAFSVPLVLTNNAPSAVFANLMPYDITRWRLGTWVATDSAYAEPGPALTQILPGAGFWFLGLTDTTLSFTGTGTPQTQFTLPLLGRGAAGTGWTQFGSPFRFPLAISQLRLSIGANIPITDPANNLTDRMIWEWNPTAASYDSVHVLLPGRAYWLWRQSATAVSLRFPFQWDPVALNAAVPAVPAGVDWALEVLASAGQRSSRLTFGAAPVLAGGWNSLSSRSIPTPSTEGISLVARVSDWGADDGGYRSVFQPDGAELAWDFDASARSGLTEASFRFVNLPAGRQVVLSEPGARWSREVRTGEAITLVLTSAPRRLRLVVRTSAGVTPQEPLATALRAVGPNPFRDATTLSFALGHGGPVRWDVFDLAGRRVRSEARTLAAGEHTLDWDGLDSAGVRVSPGLYLVRWQADGASGSVRLVRVD